MKARGMVALGVFGVVAAAVAGAACTGVDEPAGEAAAVEEAVALVPARPPRIEALVRQLNIDADLDGVARVRDETLLNAWGMAFSADARAVWISSNGAGLAEVYDATGATRLQVQIPTPKGGEPPAAPTGQVANPFTETAFEGDAFIIVTEDGTVSGWQRDFGRDAMLRVDNSKRKAIYKGVAIATVRGKARLYAADFHNGKVDMFDEHYRSIRTPGAFVDRKLPHGFAPFNVFTVGNHLLVSYAKQDDDGEDDVAGAGNGFVDVFDADGGFDARLISRGALNSPWGMVLAPEKGGDLDLMVGNFGDGMINVYDVDLRGPHFSARFEGTLADRVTREPLVIEGLWALAFGPGGDGGFDAPDLFFTAGPGGEDHGLFGRLQIIGDRL